MNEIDCGRDPPLGSGSTHSLRIRRQRIPSFGIVLSSMRGDIRAKPFYLDCSEPFSQPLEFVWIVLSQIAILNGSLVTFTSY